MAVGFASLSRVLYLKLHWLHLKAPSRGVLWGDKYVLLTLRGHIVGNVRKKKPQIIIVEND